MGPLRRTRELPKEKPGPKKQEPGLSGAEAMEERDCAKHNPRGGTVKGLVWPEHSVCFED